MLVDWNYILLNTPLKILHRLRKRIAIANISDRTWERSSWHKVRVEGKRNCYC